MINIRPTAILYKHIMFVVITCIYADQSNAAISLTADIAEKHVKHDYDDAQPDSGAIFNGNIGTLILGGNYSRGKFFSSISLEQSWKDDVSRLDTDVLLFLERNDYALTFGYLVKPNVSVFGGYKYGETVVNGVAIPPQTGANDISFIESGLFLGFSYSKIVTDKSILGFSLAYANLNAKTENRIDPFGGPGTGPASADGDADGLSLGVNWSYQLSEATSLNLGYKINRYDASGVNRAGDSYSLKSDYKFATLGLRQDF
jgi:hypothetical protein